MWAQSILTFLALGATDDEAVREVICAETGFSRAAEARDRDAFLSYVDPDARFVTGRVARGREEVGEAWAAVFQPDGPRMRWRPAVVEVTADGKLALSRGPYRSIRTGDDGEAIETWGTYISTWRRNADGHWQVLFDTGGEVDMTPSERDVEVLNAEPDCP